MMKRMVRILVRLTFTFILLVRQGLLFPLIISGCFSVGAFTRSAHHTMITERTLKIARILVIEGDSVTCLHGPRKRTSPSAHHSCLSVTSIKRPTPNHQYRDPLMIGP